MDWNFKLDGGAVQLFFRGIDAVAFTESQLLEEKAKHRNWLQQQPGMSGVGVGLTAEGEACLKIFTNCMPDHVKEQIRKRLGKVPVDFEQCGEFGAL